MELQTVPWFSSNLMEVWRTNLGTPHRIHEYDCHFLTVLLNQLFDTAGWSDHLWEVPPLSCGQFHTNRLNPDKVTSGVIIPIITSIPVKLSKVRMLCNLTTNNPTLHIIVHKWTVRVCSATKSHHRCMACTRNVLHSIRNVLHSDSASQSVRQFLCAAFRLTS